MNKSRRAFVWAALFAAVSAPSVAQAQSRWTIDAKPVVVLGADNGDTTTMFSVIVGATRLPNGQILVADNAAISLHVFAPDGKRIRSFGRKGDGPGEFSYLARFFRCEDAIVTYDLRAYRATVFNLDGTVRRAFRFGSPELAQPPYNSTNNRNCTFAHFGWGAPRRREDPMPKDKDITRPVVPFWISGADSAVRHVVGSFPGSERFFLGNAAGTGGTGTPRIFGRQPVMAVGPDRLYIGLQDTNEIMVFDLGGRKLAPIKLPGRAPVPVTRADIDAERDKRAATSPSRDSSFLNALFSRMVFPQTMPAYGRLVVDVDGNVWVQDYPRAVSPTVRWTVISTNGQPRAEVTLPADLELFEAGADYVLGKFVDSNEQIPEVRMYRLHRDK